MSVASARSGRLTMPRPPGVSSVWKRRARAEACSRGSVNQLPRRAARSTTPNRSSSRTASFDGPRASRAMIVTECDYATLAGCRPTDQRRGSGHSHSHFAAAERPSGAEPLSAPAPSRRRSWRRRSCDRFRRWEPRPGRRANQSGNRMASANSLRRTPTKLAEAPAERRRLRNVLRHRPWNSPCNNRGHDSVRSGVGVGSGNPRLVLRRASRRFEGRERGYTDCRRRRSSRSLQRKHQRRGRAMPGHL